LNRALKEKRPQYAKRHDKVILLHDNIRPHVAKSVKEHLNGMFYPTRPSLDVAPSDFHLFRSMQHGLSEQLFNYFEDIEK